MTDAVRTRKIQANGLTFAVDELGEGDSVALWQGPDEWLLLLQPEAAPPTPSAGVLVDVSHRQIALALQGPDAETRLNVACPLDLSDAAFPVDMTTRTMFAKADITLWRTAPDRFHIEVARSFADYVIGILRLPV